MNFIWILFVGRWLGIIRKSLNVWRFFHTSASGAPVFPYIVRAGQRRHGRGGGVLMRAGDGHGGVGTLGRGRVSLRLFWGHMKLRFQRRLFPRVNCGNQKKGFGKGLLYKRMACSIFIYQRGHLNLTILPAGMKFWELKKAELLRNKFNESRHVVCEKQTVPLSLWSVRASSLPPHFLMIHSRYLITSSVNLIILPKVLRRKRADKSTFATKHISTV